MGQKRESIIPKAPLHRIITSSGAKRVSEEALTVFVDILEDIATDIATHAAKIAKHSGRKTVQDGDVKLASKS